MREVLLMAPLPPPYGGISHWAMMVIAYSKAKQSTRIRLVDTAPRHRTVFQTSPVRRVVGGLPSMLRQMLEMGRALRDHKFIALHVTTSGEYALARDILALLLAKVFGRHGVLHLHIGRLPAILAKGGVECYAFQLAFALAAHVIVIDDGTYQEIRQKLPEVNVSRIPNCIDFSRLPAIPARKSQTILFVGWVVPTKGIEDLLKIWVKLRDVGWQLKIIGPLSTTYATYLAENFDMEGVQFTGEQEHSRVLDEMAEAAIFCLPSHTEGFPNVVLEAMALRCAIVATAVGAIPEMLSEGAGELIDLYDGQALLDSLGALMRCPLRREAMGNVAALRAVQRYSIQVVFNQYEAIWETK